MSQRTQFLSDIFNQLQAIKRKLIDDIPWHGGSPLPSSQLLVLYVVFENPGIALKDIARFLGVTRSAATQLVDRLEQGGHLKRQQSTTDRRGIHVHLTKKSEKHITTTMQAYMNKMAELFDVLSDKELEQYRRLNHKIISRIDGSTRSSV